MSSRLAVGVPAPPRAHAQRASKYPWDEMVIDDHFDVPIAEGEEPKKVARRVYASGRAWTRKHRPGTMPRVRIINRTELLVRCWLVEVDGYA